MTAARRPGVLRPGVLAALVLLALSASAGDWRSSNIQLLSGHGYELGSAQRDIFTLEHAQGGPWGDAYAFVDYTWRHDTHHEWYGEAYLQPSLSWLSGGNRGFGPVRDLSLSLGVNAGSEPADTPYRSWLAGIALDFAAPSFNYLSLEIHLYRDEQLPGHGWQFTPVWELPFHIGGNSWKFRGFADIRSPGSHASGQWSILTDPQLIMDIGPWLHAPAGRWWAGVEYRYWKRKFGIDGVDERLPSLMLMLAF